MKKFTLVSATIWGLLISTTGMAQISFSNANSRLHSDNGTAGSNANNRSGNSVTIVDINNDGLDDILRLDNNRYVRVEYQKAGGTFTYQYIGDIGNVGPWGMSAGDVDHNGYKDLLVGGGSQAYLFKINNTGTGFIGSGIALPNGNIFCQNGNFMDVNNDGWEDIFMCNDVNESRIWVNDGTGNFPAEANNTAIDFDVTPGTSAPNDESGNYSSVWTDFDNDGDVDFYVAHCRQGQSPGDIRRTDRLFVNNGNGTYTEDGASYNLNSNDQDWTASFGDIDNDGDFDVFLTKHDQTSRYYINDGTGNMTVSPNPIQFGNMPMQGMFEDMDNDGFVDLIITGDNDHRIYRNNGNQTFTDVTPSNLNVGSTMLAFATGDLNHDGKIDLYSSYGGTYNNPSGSIDDIYWLNTTDNQNNFITLDLRGTSSTDGALGGRAYIYGAWGVQTREVRASESYGTCNTFHLHFGLGTATAIDSIVIDWPANGSPNTKIVNPVINQFLTITEGLCVSPSNVITYSGNPVLCPSQSLTLNAATGSGYTYLWSNGATTQSIVVSTPGEYSVEVHAPGNNCYSTSAALLVELSPDETPTITANGDLEFCQGNSVVLSSSTALGYTWSNGATTQTTTITTSGSYFVTINGTCQDWNSDTLTVNVLPATPPTPGPDVFLPAPATTTVTATGNSIEWYDAGSGGNLLGSGPSYNTPLLNANTTYYAQDNYTYGGGSGAITGADITSASYSGNTVIGALIFDVHQNCTLVSVKVETDQAGIRTVELRNSGGTVLASQNVNIPVGQSTVTLNFALTPGTSYYLATNVAQNQSALGTQTPRLLRNTSGVSYPYSYAGVVDITSGSNGSPLATAYYYFYDWNITVDPTSCPSSRVPVNVTVSNVSVNDEEGSLPVSIYPNPTSDVLNINFTTTEKSDVQVALTDINGRTVLSKNLGTANGNFAQTLSLGGLAKGSYTLSLTIGTHQRNAVIVLE